ncbi:heme oxygenase (biliverdin-producing) [Gordonia shandongensis]|uniref:biliverdin-producing heme oxygenase n=1 Tax=Gordonia shandongensis TaxID=376351 RepID=UPI000425091F|nr:biliverdin-producing heme oxygenase [Gordonia shandongensis]
MTVATPDVTPDATTRLSTEMKQGSLVEHEQAENSQFMAELLDGRINEAGYIDYLQRLRIVYEALERTSRALSTDPVMGRIDDPALDRLAAIDADLAVWLDGAAPQPVHSPAATAYAARIEDSASWGGRVLAHHYTRYLGDLSGGLAIGRILDRTFGLDGAGLSFYSFTALDVATKPYKDAYRRTLDEIGHELDAADRSRIVDEVKVAFRLNHELFAELGADIESYRR